MIRRLSVLAVLLGIVLLAVLVPAGSANAASSGDIPFIDLCHPEPPYPESPYAGLTGAVAERPSKPADHFSIEHIYTSGGLAGLGSHTYDLGCAADVSSYADRANSGFNNTLTNFCVATSGFITSLADSVERRAWNPQWIQTFLSGFADRAVGVIDVRIWIPLAGLGLLATSGLLIWRARNGDVSGVAAGVGWVLLVIVTVGLIASVPTGGSSGAQKVGDFTVATLNGSDGSHAAEATTDSVVLSVQYQSYLRRTFGDNETEAAKKYGPALLEASRFSWVEMDAIRSGKKDEEKEIQRKRDDWKEVAAKVKKEYPTSYRYLQGDPSMISPVGASLLDMGFSAAISFFRIAADLLMVLCFLLLTIIAVAFVMGGAFILTPWGAPLGREMANDAARACGYALVAAISVWLFTVYAQAAMAPGMSPWWSIILLFLGTIVFWTMVRPDRKMLSMISMGHIDGTGAVVGFMRAWLLAHMVGRAVASADDDDDPAPAPPTPHEDVVVVATATDVPQPPPPAAITYLPGPAGAVTPDGGPGGPVVVEGEVVYSSDSQGQAVKTYQALPSGEPAYQRPEPEETIYAPVTPPPNGSISDDEIYQRDDETVYKITDAGSK